MTYWYNVDSGKVEEESEKSGSDHLMGPYETREAAANALASARAKTQQWDEEDREWNNPTSDD